jgi:hypothetical protein
MGRSRLAGIVRDDPDPLVRDETATSRMTARLRRRDREQSSRTCCSSISFANSPNRLHTSPRLPRFRE